MDDIQLQKNDRVLDIGCGTGILFPFLQKTVTSGGHVIALDFSSAMIRKARANSPHGISFIQAEAERIPIKDDFFDTAICFSCFPHFADKEKSLLEINRVLKEDGEIHILHTESREEINAIHKKAGGPVSHDRLPQVSEMFTIMTKAGFSGITVQDAKDFYCAKAVKKNKSI
ncbi:MAG: class I SAM-dependent methyltransferase [Candidatus Aureabacteria bacterium]|nr:class I SAM-dependent methyltransferase [Candidatus Auribacterota bacterium]